MYYYICKCGKSESWGQAVPPSCVSCPICNTTLEVMPNLHRTPDPHEWVIKHDEVSGKPYEACIKCGKTKEPR